MRIYAVCKRCFRQYYNVSLRWMKGKQWQECKVHLQWILSYVKWKHQLSDRFIFMCFLGSSIWRDSQVLLSLWKEESSVLDLFIYLFYSQIEVCVTQRYLQQLHCHIVLLVSSVCVWWCGWNCIEKKRRETKKKEIKKPTCCLVERSRRCFTVC